MQKGETFSYSFLFATLVLVVSLVFVSAAPPVYAEEKTTSAKEEAVKAAFILNFIRFTHWPGANDTIKLCIHSKNVLADDIAAFNHKKLGTKNIATATFNEWSNTDIDCQVVVINENDLKQGAQNFLGKKGILTISEADGFIKQAGIIQLLRLGPRVRFDINLHAAREAKLDLSSKLLRLARAVNG